MFTRTPTPQSDDIKINRILVEVIIHVRVQKILQCDYSLVYTNSNESSFRRIFVFGTRFLYLLSIVTLLSTWHLVDLLRPMPLQQHFFGDNCPLVGPSSNWTFYQVFLCW